MSPDAEAMPRARLLLSSVAPRWQHAAARRQGLTEDDVLGLLDAALGLDRDLDDGPAVEFDAARSRHDEVALAYDWAQARQVGIRRLGLIANLERPWMLATVGWHVTGCSLGGQCSVEFLPSWAQADDADADMPPGGDRGREEPGGDRDEAGSGSGREAMRRSDRYRDVLPEQVERRLQWQLATSGLDHAHVATVAGGRLAENYVAFPDEPVIELLIATATDVWQCVRQRRD